MSRTAPHRADITGLVLAGGRGSRMGGVDKGLQNFQGQPLALRAMQRLAPQVGPLLINANRSLTDYETFGMAVVSDAPESGEFAGPLAGLLAGLTHCKTPWLLTVPCDTPFFPQDLADRLASAIVSDQADLAVAAIWQTDENGEKRQRMQPVFCLLATRLAPSLKTFLNSGGRKVGAWLAQHKKVQVVFDAPHDDPQAFFNVNTLDELHRLEQAG